jgi:ribose transport system permease protein
MTISELVRRSRLATLSAVYMIVLMVMIFAMLEGRLFSSSQTLRSILSGTGIEGMLALGVLVPFVIGILDFQFAYVAGTGLVLMARLSNDPSMSIWIGALITVVVCTSFGALSGLLVSRLHVSSLIVTLGVGQLVLGLGWILIGSQTIGATINSPVFLWLGNGTVGPFPSRFLIFLGLAVLTWFWLERTPSGRYARLTGSNRVAARLAGINVARIEMVALTYSSFIAGITSVIWCAQVESATNGSGSSFLFPVISVVLLGSTQVKSRFNVLGTVIALLLLATAVEGVGLKESGDATWISNMFAGVFLLGALWASAWQARSLGRRQGPTETASLAGAEQTGRCI